MTEAFAPAGADVGAVEVEFEFEGEPQEAKVIPATTTMQDIERWQAMNMTG
jgi:hypothetical protein